MDPLIEVIWLIDGHKHDKGPSSFVVAPVVLLGDRPPLVISALPAIFLVVWGKQHTQHGRLV